MGKFEQLVKEGKISKVLMEDKDFVSKAKEIFKSENIDIDNKKLSEIMDNIETQLKKNPEVLEYKELEQVSGGISNKKLGRGAIKAVTTISGAAVGFALGTGIGGLSGKGIAENVIKNFREQSNYEQRLVEDYKNRNNYEQSVLDEIGTRGGMHAGGVTLTPVGAYIGYKLGDLVCEKLGLSE